MSNETPTEHFEAAEHAEQAAHEGAPFLSTVSVTIAILGVVAASVASLETIETAGTLTAQNVASLLQNKTSDHWAFFQAKSIRQNAYEIASRQSSLLAAEFAREAKRYEKESADIQIKANEFEHQVEQRLREAERHEHGHHILTEAVTLVHIATP